MFNAVGQWLFDSSELTPHGFCLLWQPGLIWTYALADAGIALAYFSIPVALAIIAGRRRDLVFRPVLWLFAAFILLCGATHWLDVVLLWQPAYGLQAVVKAATAGVSILTAIMVWRLLPQALEYPSPAQLRLANAALQASQEKLHQAQKMEAVGQLTGGIAHDFNNMIQVISAGLTLIERRIDTSIDIKRYVTSMRGSLDRTTSLANRLLAFSRRQPLQPRVIEPGRLITEMHELLKNTLGSNIQLRMKLGDDERLTFCDPHQLESALLNLAINARDAMPEGGTLTISLAERELTDADLADQDGAKPGAYVEIRVSDSGVGMAPDIARRAFEPFFTTKPTGQGTGLGLSQVYGFVRQSGGVVRIDSLPDKGASIVISLPAFKGDPPQRKADEERSLDLGTAGSSARGRVLVVEDDEAVRSQIVEALSDMGCSVWQARDGGEGLRILQSGEPIDLMITDIGMPVLNGRQLADAARALDARLPILLITGYAGNTLDEELGSGMELIRKPFVLGELTRRVGALLARSAAGTGAPGQGRSTGG